MRSWIVVAGVAAYACLVAYALVAMKKSVPEMVREADHVVTARVTAVDVVGRDGQPSKRDETSLTRPEVIRLHVAVDSLRILKGGDGIPSTLVLPLWRGWGHSRNDVTGDMLDKEFVFFLSGPEFSPLFLGEYYVPVDEFDNLDPLRN
jgi:hypothetical protein